MCSVRLESRIFSTNMGSVVGVALIYCSEYADDRQCIYADRSCFQESSAGCTAAASVYALLQYGINRAGRTVWILWEAVGGHGKVSEQIL